MHGFCTETCQVGTTESTEVDYSSTLGEYEENMTTTDVAVDVEGNGNYVATYVKYNFCNFQRCIIL